MKVFLLLVFGALLGIALLPYLLFQQPEMPPGTNLASPDYAFSSAELLIDRTYHNEAGIVLEHRLFDAALTEIREAETFLIADFFLWNPWQGALTASSGYRALSGELAAALIAKRIQNPEMPILVISDPINRIYGDMAPAFYDAMAEADIPVVFTALERLPESNRLYAPQAWFWRKFLPAQEDDGSRLVPNPFDPDGKSLSLAQFGRLLHFKANHRKVLITGRRTGPARLLVGSLNPADGSAQHSNLGLLVDGEVARFAAQSELAVAGWSAASPAQVHGGRQPEALAAAQAIEQRLARLPEGPLAGPGQASVAYRSELAIREELILQLQQAVSGTRIDIGLFYFSDRAVVEALEAAIRRGATARLLLDANRDAFGREKNGIPNRIVAAELMELAEDFPVEVRWAATQGEQFHGKFMRVTGSRQNCLILGSANWTRRNLANLNLESNLILKDSPAVFSQFDAYFDTLWNNTEGSKESLPYPEWAESGWSLTWKTWLYRFQEWSGASTF